MRRAGLLTLIVAGLLGCDIPRDANGTLDRVKGGTIRVGLTSNPPWVAAPDARSPGIEPELLRAWAAELGARIEWVRGSETALVQALRAGLLDVIAAGLLETTPFSSSIGVSQPYLETEVRFARPAAAPAPSDWKDREVGVAPGRITLAALAREEGARPIMEGASAGEGAVVLYDFEAAASGLVPDGPVLATERHVLAVRAGESRFLLALDRFLQRSGAEAARQAAAREAGR